jgi:hypothetical protein
MIPGKIPRECQSTTKCYCYTCLILLLYVMMLLLQPRAVMMLLLQPHAVDDDVVVIDLPTLDVDFVEKRPAGRTFGGWMLHQHLNLWRIPHF